MSKDIEIYEELKSNFNEENLLLYETIALGVFTQGYLHLKRALYEESLTVTENEIEEFAERALRINAALKDMEQLMIDVSSELQTSIFKILEMENGDVLDNAFANYLKNNLQFTYEELMKHFEDKYSEKQLVKYIGNIPIYKRKMIFTKEQINKKMEELIEAGVIFCESYEKKKGVKLEGKVFVSMPVVYGIFVQPWYPIVDFPEVKAVGSEIRKVLYELLTVEAEEKQIGKMLKLIFKDSNQVEALKNLAGILSMYYEQMGENKPEFIIEEQGEPRIIISNEGIYETVEI